MKIPNRKKVWSCFLAFFMLLPLVTMSRVNAQEAVPGTIVDSNGLKVVMTIDSQWQGFCNGTISITNTGTETIDNFAYSFDFPYEITNIWNAAILEHANGVYTVKNLGWNQDIPAGGTASIGFTAAVDGDVTLPTFFVLNTKEADVPAESVKVEYISYSDWGTGFSGAIRVTNLCSTPIEDYRLNLSFAREITTISNATILSHEGSNYSITNNGSNQNLAPNQTFEIGISGTGGTATDTITSYSVRQITTRFDLVSDTDGDTYADWLEVCVRGTDPLIPEGTNPTPTPTIIPTPTPPDVSPTPIPPIDYETDTDGDGIPNYFEIEIGLDINAADTDGDGLDDYLELSLFYNPLSTDSDNDGTSDFDEDIDNDGLSSREESVLGTAIVYADTDEDGLSDGEEVREYLTNPLIIDSDEDKLSDYDEVCISLDPLNPSTRGVPDNEFTKEYVFQENSEVLSKINSDSNPYQLSFTIGAAGNVASNIQVKESPYAGTMSNDAILGIVPEISYDENMLVDSVKICFQIDTEVIANPESVYASVNQEFSGLTRFCIFRFDEDLSMLLPVETQYDELSQTAYCETNVLGSYCLMDMEIWLQSIGISPQDLSVEADPILYSDGSEQMLTVDLLDEKTQLDSSEEYAVNFEASVAQDFGDIISLLSSSEVVADGYFKGHRYAVLDKGLTWEDAKAYCEYMAGHLVTITSQEEQAFIESILVEGKRNSYWIGAEISASGTYPKWITGELISYKNYYRYQPDDAYGSEDALMIYRFNNGTGPCFGFWNDLKRDGTCGTQPFFGTSNFGLICEWETAVKLVYATSLKACTIPNILSKVADDDADGDGIPNWQEIDPDSTLGYWNIDGTYIPKSFANILAEHGVAQVFARYNVNPLIISVIPLRSDPQSIDSDKDGLFDYSAQYVGSKKVAPQDPDPQFANGPIGVWQEHISTQEQEQVSHELGNFYTYNPFNPLVYFGGIHAPPCVWFGNLLMFRMDKENTAFHSQTRTDINRALTDVKDIVFQPIEGDTLFLQQMSEEIASPYLQMDEFNKNYVNFLSTSINWPIETWQYPGGYNDLYDTIFGAATNGNMRREKIEFTSDEGTFIIWFWRGDYLNIGSGTEVGLYTNPHNLPIANIEQWDSVNFVVPMTLNLYNYYGKTDVQNIFSWSPYAKQWWITGFNPSPEFSHPKVEDMVTISTIDFGEKTELYDAVKIGVEKKPEIKDFVIFDDARHTIWLLWWEK